MPKYLFQGKYSQDGLALVREKGGSARREAGTAMVDAVGGKVESFNFAFGDNDLIAIVELPDNGAAAALSTSLVASGRFSHFSTVPLLTPEEVDAAMAGYDV